MIEKRVRAGWSFDGCPPKTQISEGGEFELDEEKDASACNLMRASVHKLQRNLDTIKSGWFQAGCAVEVFVSKEQ